MSNKKIIISIPFNVNTFSDERLTKEWIDGRISIFIRFTLQSLKNQNNQDFLTLAQYEDDTKDLVNQALSKYIRLPDNVRFVKKSKHRDFIIKSSRQYNYLYLVRLDSDDMYHKSFIQQLHDFNQKEETEALINQKGYIYDSVQKHLAHYFDPSPPFYTLIYKTEDYLKGKSYRVPGGHPSVIKLNHEILEKPNYMVVIHSSNNSTTFDINQRKQIIENEYEVKQLLRDFMGSAYRHVHQ